MEARALAGENAAVKTWARGKGDISQAEKYLDDLEQLGLDKNRAQEAQRIGTLPAGEKAKAYKEAKNDEILPTISMLIDVARPYWYKANRRRRRGAIADKAAQAAARIGAVLLLAVRPASARWWPFWRLGQHSPSKL